MNQDDWFRITIKYADGQEEVMTYPPHRFFKFLQSEGAKRNMAILSWHVERVSAS